MKTSHLRTTSLLSISLATLALVASPQSAEACGGFFCDAGPTVMPVDQTGESIIFWIDNSGASPHTEAHIQIQYEGDPERFAWIIPVQQIPEVLVGSQTLFDNVLQATVPTFTTNSRTIGDCNSGGSIGFCLAKDDAGTNQALSTGGSDGGTDTDGPEIIERGLAGAFEYVVLTGDNIQEIVDWLDQAGYAQDEDAPPILQEYLDEGFVFVAVKLQSGAETDEIHPLAIRYAGVEPCIPIRLTRIAAIDDMAIRAFFLGEDRVAPQNWPHVELNHSRFDWVNGPQTSYNEVVGLAIDEAGGRAFVTEYAGTDAIVSTSGLLEDSWSAAAFEGIAPTSVWNQLRAQGLVACVGDEDCVQEQIVHPQVEALLSKYLPAPDGVDELVFWSNLGDYADMIDMAAWDAQPGFAADFDARIIVPGGHAIDMLEDATQLTRLFTLLSPHEMIEDPLFHPTSGLPIVDNNITATRVTDCDGGPTFYELADGRTVAVDVDGAMPELDANPAAERVERVPMMGPPQVEVDNAAQIDTTLDAYNDTRLDGPGCTISRVGLEGLLAFLGIFGVAWFNRGRRGRAS